MQIFLGILVSLVIGYMWMRFVDRAFSHRKLRLRFTSKMFFHSFVLVILLFGYQYVLLHQGWESQYFLNNFSPWTIVLFVVYCSILILLLAFLYRNASKKSMLNLLIVGSLLFLGVSLGGYFLGINIIVMYYILSAYAEEYLKFGTGNNVFLGESKTGKSNRTDLILFCILMGLGFAGIENLFFVGQNILASWQGGTEISVSVLTTGRGLIATLLHVVSTGIIAYAILYFEKSEFIPCRFGKLTSQNNREARIQTGSAYTESSKKFLNKNPLAVQYKQKKHIPAFVGIIIAIVMGVALHAFYNLSLHFGRKFLLIPFVILCYFLLSFLLFRSDRMYDPKS